MRYFTYAFWILLILLGVTFAVINPHAVVIHYYVGSINIYLPLLLLIGLVIGAILGLLVLLPGYLKMKNALRKLRKHNKRLEKDMENLQIRSREDSL